MEITLIDNTLTKTEAKYLMRAFINEKLNFHKLRRLQQKEGDALYDTSWDDARIEELEEVQKNLAIDFQDLPEAFPVDCVAYLNEPLDEDDLYDEDE